MMESEIEELRSKLKESESQQIAIAKLAKEILEKDKDKDRRLTALGEENLQQSRDIARLQALLKTRDEYLADSENEVTKLRTIISEMNDNKSSYMIELEQKISSLRAEVTEKNGILLDREQEIQELSKNLAAKERDLEEASKKPLNEVSLNQTRDVFNDSERTKLNEKVAELELERNLMFEEISQLQDKITAISRDLDNERSRAEELTSICNGYRHDVEELRQRCNDLTSELNEYRNNTKVAKKGNSMFFEFVDERVKLEKDLLKLKAQNDFFVAQKEAYEEELNELRHELILALSLRTGEGKSGGDTSVLQQEISRLRTELATVNAKLLEKCRDNVQAQKVNISNNSRLVDLKDYSLNSLKEEVRTLSWKLDRAEKERVEYFDKFRDIENRYSEECRRSRELLNDLTCLKKRFAMEQRKYINSAVSQTLKPSKEKLSEKIANVNTIKADDPTISGMQSSYTITDFSLTSAKHSSLTSLKEVENTEVTSEIGTSSIELIPASSESIIAEKLPELKVQADDTAERGISVEKRLKFQLPDEESSWSLTQNENKESIHTIRRKPKRKIFRKVCEANNL